MKVVLFDMDGVLIESEIYYMNGTYKWMKEKGYNGSFENLCKIVGTTLETAYKMLSDMLDNKYSAEEVKTFNEKYFSDYPLDFKNIMKSNSLELMCFLKNNGIKIAVCSSSPKDNIIHVMKECGFDKYVDYLVSGEEFTHSKPNPEIYLTACKELDVNVEDCFVIEDSKIGIAAGKNAGIKVIAIKDSMFFQDQSNADFIFETMEEIELFFKKHLNSLV